MRILAMLLMLLFSVPAWADDGRANVQAPPPAIAEAVTVEEPLSTMEQFIIGSAILGGAFALGMVATGSVATGLTAASAVAIAWSFLP